MDRVALPPAARAEPSAAEPLRPICTETAGMQSSFVVYHSSTTDIADGVEPESILPDKFAHTRGKRKRTSREDFAVLEGEYQRNPRPDKASRTAIVGRVSMTEKEVQIWFQNRRQMTRRKCRTWQPNEITSIIRSSQEQHGPAELDAILSSSQEPIAFQSSGPSLSHVRNRSSSPHTEGELSQAAPASSESSQPLRQTIPTEPNPEVSTMSPEHQCKEASNKKSEVKCHDEVEPDVSDSLNQDESVDADMLEKNNAQASPGTVPARSGLKRKSSAVRLSLSFSGKAEVLVGSESPSPPKKIALDGNRLARATPLQRSQSAINATSPADCPLGVDIPEWKRSRAPGRSRDARTWEFYCDSDVRNALTKSAEHDQKGSAQAVLGLIRSSSGNRKPLTPIKRENVSLQSGIHNSKKTATSRVTSRGKLERTMSSAARLQTMTSDEAVKPPKSKLADELEIWQDNFGDSDKENQDPEGDGVCRVSKDPCVSTLTSSRRKSEASMALQDKENCNIISKHTRAEDELDAVQNLLRLSQGEWC